MESRGHFWVQGVPISRFDSTFLFQGVRISRFALKCLFHGIRIYGLVRNFGFPDSISGFVSNFRFHMFGLQDSDRNVGFTGLDLRSFTKLDFRIRFEIWVSQIWISGFGLKFGFGLFGFQDLARNVHPKDLEFTIWVEI